MPELPEVEHVTRGIKPFALNHKITDVSFSQPVILGKENGKATIIKGISLDDFKRYTVNYTITNIHRRSKYILFEIQHEQSERILISHLGMAGGFFIVNEINDIPILNYRKHWQVVFHLENGMKLVYSDIRRFGEIRNVEALTDYPSLLEIAPEPFEDEALAHFLSKSNERKYSKMAIKAFILDHRVIAGCGNIYACEALYDAKLNPNTKVNQLSNAQKTAVFDSVVKVLNMGILNGGTSVSDYVHADGQKGTMQDYLNVYKKKNCTSCDSTIETAIIAGRNTHFCPVCQR